MRRFRRIEVPRLVVPLPRQLEPLRTIEPHAVRSLETLHERLLERAFADDTVRWHDRIRGYAHSPLRSALAADAFAGALEEIGRHHRAVLDAMAFGHWDAIEKIREIIVQAGYRAVPDPVWGGILVLAEHERDPLPEFPAWLVREETKKLAQVFEYQLQRAVSQHEIDTVVRGAAEEVLRVRQNAALRETGQDLRQQESAKRSDRRRRARAKRVRYAPTLRERLHDAVTSQPTAGVKTLSDTLHVRLQDVSEELRKMEQAGEIATERRGRGVYRNAFPKPVPSEKGEGPRLRVETARKRVADSDPDAEGGASDLEHAVVARALKRLQVR